MVPCAVLVCSLSLLAQQPERAGYRAERVWLASLLDCPSVQMQLHLAATQVAQIASLSHLEVRSASRQNQSVNGYAAALVSYSEKALGVLNARQARRLSQIEMQSDPASALETPGLRHALSLTRSQCNEVDRLLLQFQQRANEASASALSAGMHTRNHVIPSTDHARIALSKELAARCMLLLTMRQHVVWKRLMGAPAPGLEHCPERWHFPPESD